VSDKVVEGKLKELLPHFEYSPFQSSKVPRRVAEREREKEKSERKRNRRISNLFGAI
jgi:hypothetical protein